MGGHKYLRGRDIKGIAQHDIGDVSLIAALMKPSDKISVIKITVSRTRIRLLKSVFLYKLHRLPPFPSVQ